MTQQQGIPDLPERPRENPAATVDALECKIALESPPIPEFDDGDAAEGTTSGPPASAEPPD